MFDGKRENFRTSYMKVYKARSDFNERDGTISRQYANNAGGKSGFCINLQIFSTSLSPSTCIASTLKSPVYGSACFKLRDGPIIFNFDPMKAFLESAV